MFCPNCGSENPNDANVCKSCGKPLKAEKTSAPTVNKSSAKPIAVLVVAVAVVVMAVIFFINSANTINLNKYLVFETSGANGYGRVYISFDEEKFVEDNGDKFKLNKKGKKALSKEYNFDAEELLEYLEEYTNDYIADSFISYGVNIDYESSHNLSNGDKVEYTIDFDDEVSEYFDFKIKSKPGTYKVSGLEEVKTKNYFEKIKVSYSGISPNGGYVNINTNDVPSELGSIGYTIENVSNGQLSNGDKFTITLDADSIERNIANYGYAPLEASREYTVEGLKELVTKTSQYSKEDLEYMLGEAEDSMTAYAAKRWNQDEVELVSLEHVGTWVLHPKKGTNKNYTYLAFDTTVHMSNDEGFDETKTFTWYVWFENTYIANGKVDFEESKINSAETDYYNTVSWCKDGSDSCWYSDVYSFYGYKDTDTFIKAKINSMVDNYVVDGGLLD